MKDFFDIATLALMFSVATFIFVVACSIPYWSKTDRLWKTGDDKDENLPA